MSVHQKKKRIGTDKNIKIYKSATKVSIMDVNSALDYHKEKNNEVSYRGNIVFVINEYGKSKNQLQAFLPKATAKMIFHTIQTGMFMGMFPNGYKKYGGSPKTKRARVLTVQFDPQRNRYMFQIEEGQGQTIKNGAMKMVKRDKSVQTYVSLEDTLEMAIEVTDFIRHEELISLINNEPLYSYSTYQNQGNNNQFNNQQNQQFTQINQQNQQITQNNQYDNNQQFNANHNHNFYNNQQNFGNVNYI